MQHQEKKTEEHSQYQNLNKCGCASCSLSRGWETSGKMTFRSILQNCAYGEGAHPKNGLAGFMATENESVLSASPKSATCVSVDYVMSPLVETAVYSLLIPVSLSICFVHRDLRRLTSGFPHTKE